MGRFTVRIGGEEKVFKDADNLRRYIMRYGDKTKRYTYHGESKMPLDEYGIMYYTKSEGWKIKTKIGSTYHIDRRTGSVYEGGRFTVRWATKGKSNQTIWSCKDMDDAINQAISIYARNRGAKVYVYDRDKKLGRIGEKNDYPTWISYKTKQTYSFRDDMQIVPPRPKDYGKKPGWVLAGRVAGSGRWKYYTGESFVAKRQYAMVWPYNKYDDVVAAAKDLSHWGMCDGFEFRIERE